MSMPVDFNVGDPVRVVEGKHPSLYLGVEGVVTAISYASGIMLVTLTGACLKEDRGSMIQGTWLYFEKIFIHKGKTFKCEEHA